MNSSINTFWSQTCPRPDYNQFASCGISLGDSCLSDMSNDQHSEPQYTCHRKSSSLRHFSTFSKVLHLPQKFTDSPSISPSLSVCRCVVERITRSPAGAAYVQLIPYSDSEDDDEEEDTEHVIPPSQSFSQGDWGSSSFSQGAQSFVSKVGSKHPAATDWGPQSASTLSVDSSVCLLTGCST